MKLCGGNGTRSAWRYLVLVVICGLTWVALKRSLVVFVADVSRYCEWIIHPPFSSGRDDNHTVKSYEINTGYGDRFKVSIIFENRFPSTDFVLHLDSNERGKFKLIFERELIGNAGINQATEAENVHPRIELSDLFDSPMLRCYEFWNGSALLWKNKVTGEFHVGVQSDFDDWTWDCHREITPWARDQFRTGDWHWVRMFGVYLVHQGDKGAKDDLRRWASGRVSKAELAINKGKRTRTHMQLSAKAMLQKL